MTILESRVNVTQQRYGGPATGAFQPLADDQLNEVLRTQLGHRSVRAFAPAPVSEALLGTIIAAAQSASTSSNLQAWSVVVVRDPARKDRLATLAGDQDFIRRAPVFLVWLVDLARIDQIAAAGGHRLEGADYVESAFAAELGLPPRTFAAFGHALGWPDPDQPSSVKPRLPQAAVVHLEQYASEAQPAAVAEYEERMATFYATQEMQHSWTDRVTTRLTTAASLKGRERMREALANLGFPLR